MKSQLTIRSPLFFSLCTARSKYDSSQLGLFASVIGHVGDGNFHQAVMYEDGNPEQQAAVARCVHTMMDRALEMEGTVSVRERSQIIASRSSHLKTFVRANPRVCCIGRARHWFGEEGTYTMFSFTLPPSLSID